MLRTQPGVTSAISSQGALAKVPLTGEVLQGKAGLDSACSSCSRYAGSLQLTTGIGRVC